MQNYIDFSIRNQKDMQRIQNIALHILKTFPTLPFIVLVYFHRRNNGSEKYLQADPYNKNEANKSIEENASETIEQSASKKKWLQISP